MQKQRHTARRTNADNKTYRRFNTLCVAWIMFGKYIITFYFVSVRPQCLIARVRCLPIERTRSQNKVTEICCYIVCIYGLNLLVNSNNCWVAEAIKEVANYWILKLLISCEILRLRSIHLRLSQFWV